MNDINERPFHRDHLSDKGFGPFVAPPPTHRDSTGPDFYSRKEGNPMRKGYKVLLARGKKRLFSSFASGSARVEYVPGVRAEAPGGTALFVFDSLKEARSYAESMAHLFGKTYEIWGCEYIPSSRRVRDVLCDPSRLSDVVFFWKNPSLVGYLRKEKAPSGTKFASSLVLSDFVCRYYEDGPAEGEWQL